MAIKDEVVESIASEFHARYEAFAPGHNYRTRDETAVPWSEVPANNRALMCEVVKSMIQDGIIFVGRS